MSVRELQGWAPRTVTRAADGSVLSVSVAEPRFTRREVAVLLASRRAERVRRGPHGVLMSEATARENKFKFRVPLPTEDYAAKALHVAQEKYRKDYPNASMDSLLWRVEKRD